MPAVSRSQVVLLGILAKTRKAVRFCGNGHDAFVGKYKIDADTVNLLIANGLVDKYKKGCKIVYKISQNGILFLQGKYQPPQADHEKEDHDVEGLPEATEEEGEDSERDRD